MSTTTAVVYTSEPSMLTAVAACPIPSHVVYGHVTFTTMRALNCPTCVAAAVAAVEDPMLGAVGGVVVDVDLDAEGWRPLTS